MRHTFGLIKMPSYFSTLKHKLGFGKDKKIASKETSEEEPYDYDHPDIQNIEKRIQDAEDELAIHIAGNNNTANDEKLIQDSEAKLAHLKKIYNRGIKVGGKKKTKRRFQKAVKIYRSNKYRRLRKH